MDFRLTEDQRALADGTRGLMARLYPAERLREDAAGAAAGTPVTLDRGMWRALGEAGFFALRLPEERGGLGLGLPEAVLVFEEAGRALLPGPLVTTHLAAGWVPGAAEGGTVVTAVDGELTEWLEASDRVLGSYDKAEPVRSVDPLTPLHRVVGGEPAGGVVGGGVTAGGVLEGGVTAGGVTAGELLTCAQQTGSAARTLELAVRHATTREQFGRPIGSFQAVKHLCADMLVRAEMARTAVRAAAVSGDLGETAAARLLADEAAVRNARDCLQVFGGMGFTWEAEVHLHIKRSWILRSRGRSVAECEERLAESLLDETLCGI
ncbi:acyl-CoA dehydrogenase family protein [Actinacidiphila glaucinigra]|uniref:Acyl-CoA dehydrogenase, N-terminal domain n=1 Tax=Actinacidiphila glaucinigra TaxID=235986 RepID=A0A239B0M7_9ACTN|nr:acyl-CoA dehydrogenase family protein [Actinacidiphila glaucinigra]SNS01309.1 Acyl-CoA dehydrogenase, N-terminal domain [Actinacidiphila glaucinigra]